MSNQTSFGRNACAWRTNEYTSRSRSSVNLFRHTRMLTLVTRREGVRQRRQIASYSPREQRARCMSIARGTGLWTAARAEPQSRCEHNECSESMGGYGVVVEQDVQ